MVDIQQTTRTAGAGDLSWIGDWDRTHPGRSITLDGDLFPAGDFPDGTVPSGTLLSEVAATGLYGPWAAGGTDARGFLEFDARVQPGHNTSASLVFTGVVDTDALPEDLVAEARTELATKFEFVVK
jgi:hypothetical protein